MSYASLLRTLRTNSLVIVCVHKYTLCVRIYVPFSYSTQKICHQGNVKMLAIYVRRYCYFNPRTILENRIQVYKYNVYSISRASEECQSVENVYICVRVKRKNR